MPIKPNMPIMPIMPIMPNMPPKTHQQGRHLPRRGKDSATTFFPDAGRIAPIHA